MSRGLVVRPVRENDYRAVTALLIALGRPAPTPESHGGCSAAFRRHVSYLDTASLVAEREGRVVGFLAMQYRERLNRTTPEAWISELAVADEERNSGAAGALFERAVAFARRRECHRLVLETDPERERPYQLRTSEHVLDGSRILVVALAEG